jgi:hypothetical protein
VAYCFIGLNCRHVIPAHIQSEKFFESHYLTHPLGLLDLVHVVLEHYKLPGSLASRFNERPGTEHQIVPYNSLSVKMICIAQTVYAKRDLGSRLSDLFVGGDFANTAVGGYGASHTFQITHLGNLRIHHRITVVTTVIDAGYLWESLEDLS